MQSKEQHFGTGKQTISFTTGQLNTGVYIIEFITPETTITKQIVVSK